MTKTLEQQAATLKPKSADLTKLPAVPEVEMGLYRRAYDNHQNQFRGSVDAAGTIVLRVYLGSDAAEAHKGEIVTASVADNTSMEKVPSKFGGQCYKIEWVDTAIKGGVVVAWAPLDAPVTGFKALL